jgi:hypothetical protein
MPVTPPKPSFIRKLDDSDPRLLVSVCGTCGKMLAAAASPRVLTIVEKAHQCFLIKPFWHNPARKSA